MLVLVIFAFQQKTSKKKKMQSQFAVKEYIKLLQFHYNFVPWEKPVASIAEMEQWLKPSGKQKNVENMLL